MRRVCPKVDTKGGRHDGTAHIAANCFGNVSATHLVATMAVPRSTHATARGRRSVPHKWLMVVSWGTLTVRREMGPERGGSERESGPRRALRQQDALENRSKQRDRRARR